MNVALRELFEDGFHDFAGSRRDAAGAHAYDYLLFVEFSGLGVLLGLRLYFAEIFKTLDCHCSVPPIRFTRTCRGSARPIQV